MAGDHGDDDIQQFMEHKRFMAEVEQGIRIANRELIHKRIPHVTREHVLSFAVAVARLRARYLEASFNIGKGDHGDPPGTAQIEDLKQKRAAFEETKVAFESLCEAIEKGYVTLASENADTMDT